MTLLERESTRSIMVSGTMSSSAPIATGTASGCAQRGGVAIALMQLVLGQIRMEADAFRHAPVLQHCHMTPYDVVLETGLRSLKEGASRAAIRQRADYKTDHIPAGTCLDDAGRCVAKKR